MFFPNCLTWEIIYSVPKAWPYADFKAIMRILSFVHLYKHTDITVY